MIVFSVQVLLVVAIVVNIRLPLDVGYVLLFEVLTHVRGHIPIVVKGHPTTIVTRHLGVSKHVLLVVRGVRGERGRFGREVHLRKS